MKTEDSTVNFDLSTLSLSELVTLYEKVDGFLEFLDSQKIDDGKGGEDNE